MQGDRHHSENGRTAEITADLVFQARAKLSDNKVSGISDAMVSEMIKALPFEKTYVVENCFQERFMGSMEAPNSWKLVQLVFLKKAGRRTQEGHQRLSSCCFDECNEQMVRVVRDDVGRKRAAAGIVEQIVGGRHQKHKLPAPSRDGDKLAAEALGVAGTPRSHDETRMCGASHDVSGQLGHQDSL